MEIHPVGHEVFHADWETNRHDNAIAFRNFAKVPKNDSSKHYQLSHLSSGDGVYSVLRYELVLCTV